ncbi:hypothetical protein BU23DRAFT_527977 [Bimuria novae-zelandiae CBS 107.79]|uniref:SnoaL-like domain-containing protein n=1 Tax=Bimuria novae-zelandiae CBS 107.79 TaxID=1447943 RepID=A0A6A5VJL5_9PLEO|nr:hypothetical protein BU23DRAFT_527977 [Bimuria novae-zelandiae CBS 107.79]
MEDEIVALATAHIESYASAAAQGRDNKAPLDQLADAYSVHYLPTWTAFMLGNTKANPDREGTKESLLYALEHYRKHGLGTDVRKATSRVVKISATSALCFITWRMVIPAGEESALDNGACEDAIEFEDLYGFRAAENGLMKGGWEFVVADQEVLAVLSRVPNIFD